MQMDGIQGLAGWRWILIIVSSETSMCIPHGSLLTNILGGRYYRCNCFIGIPLCHRLPGQAPPTPQAILDRL